MRQLGNVCFSLLWMTVLLLIMVSNVGWANDMLGGITFLGEREDVCVTIEGESISSIDFQLDTCDSNMKSKKEYKDKMPFTLLVPNGTHQLLIKKNGKVVANEPITINAEKVLEYQLPQ